MIRITIIFISPKIPAADNETYDNLPVTTIYGHILGDEGLFL
jgi:hypothetical protein